MRVQYFEEASSIGFRTSSVYGLKTLGVMLRFKLHEAGRLKAAIFLP